MITKSFLILLVSMFALLNESAVADPSDVLMVRLAKLEIDAAHLEAYKAALKEEIETSIRVEPGVIALNAVAEKDKPTRITILEVYAKVDAYKAHIETPHFKKYKAGTQHMVKSLELVEVDPILLGNKTK